MPEKDVALAVKVLNNMPRKYLNYQTPHKETFAQNSSIRHSWRRRLCHNVFARKYNDRSNLV